MNPESPKFEAKTIKTFSIPDGAKMLVFEQTFFNEVPTVDAKESIPEVEIPVIMPPISSPEVTKKVEEPTESQLFWRKMYQTGELSPYKKNKGPVKFDAVKEVFNNFSSKSLGEHIMAIDKDFRGGVEIGDTKERAQRMAVMVGNMAPFMVFDIATSIPSSLLSEYAKLRVDDHSKFTKGLIAGFTKTIEVENDKVVTALGDIAVANLTGEKGAWTREGSDKLADLLQTGFDDRLKDTINGPVLESVMRFIYQIPIGGALWEQFWTRLTLLQEKSPLSKGIAKSFYMGIGMAIGVYREVKDESKNPKRSPSARISKWIWNRLGVV